MLHDNKYSPVDGVVILEVAVRPVFLLLTPLDLIHSVGDNETLKRLQHVTKLHY